MKLKTLTLAEKMKLLDRVDAGATMKKICEEFDLRPSTFYDIKKNREKIREHSLSLKEANSTRNSLKRIKVMKNPGLNEAVYNWYEQQHASGVNVRGVDIQHAAIKIAENMKIKDFVASSGWLYNFRTRHSLNKRRIVSEEVSADEESGQPFRKKLAIIIEECHLLLSQVYNAETDLHRKAGPGNKQAKKKKKIIPSRKSPKDRVSIITCDIGDRKHRPVFRDDPLEEDPITDSVIRPPVPSEDDDSDEGACSKPKLSNLRFHLDKAVELMGRLPDLDNHYHTLCSIRTAVIKQQHSEIDTSSSPW